MADLSPMQANVLAFVVKHIKDIGVPPTRRELCIEFGWASENAAEDHLKALARKGAIEFIPRIARGIKVLAL